MLDLYYNCFQIFASSIAVIWICYRYLTPLRKFARDSFQRGGKIGSPFSHLHGLYHLVFAFSFFGYVLNVVASTLWFFIAMQPSKFGLKLESNSTIITQPDANTNTVLFVADILAVQTEAIMMSAYFWTLAWVVRARISSKIHSLDFTPQLGDKIQYRFATVMGFITCVLFLALAASFKQIFPATLSTSMFLRPFILDCVWTCCALVLWANIFAVVRSLASLHESLAKNEPKSNDGVKENRAYWRKKVMDRLYFILGFLFLNFTTVGIFATVEFAGGPMAITSFAYLIFKAIRAVTTLILPLICCEVLINSLRWLGWRKSGTYQPLAQPNAFIPQVSVKAPQMQDRSVVDKTLERAADRLERSEMLRESPKLSSDSRMGETQVERPRHGKPQMQRNLSNPNEDGITVIPGPPPRIKTTSQRPQMPEPPSEPKNPPPLKKHHQQSIQSQSRVTPTPSQLQKAHEKFLFPNGNGNRQSRIQTHFSDFTRSSVAPSEQPLSLSSSNANKSNAARDANVLYVRSKAALDSESNSPKTSFVPFKSNITPFADFEDDALESPLTPIVLDSDIEAAPSLHIASPAQAKLKQDPLVTVSPSPTIRRESTKMTEIKRENSPNETTQEMPPIPPARKKKLSEDKGRKLYVPSVQAEVQPLFKSKVSNLIAQRNSHIPTPEQFNAAIDDMESYW